MLANTLSAALFGIEALPVQVEVNTGEVGELKFILVGLPDAAVKESQDRVFSAISNSGYRQPETRTTVNLAPGDLRKEGPAYDLPITLGVLAAMKQCQATTLQDYLIAGELSLSGKTRPVKGSLAMAQLARQLNKKGLLLPEASAPEAALVSDIQVIPIQSLDQAIKFLNREISIKPLSVEPALFSRASNDLDLLDFSDVKGQHKLRRAIEISVSGGHNLIMIGSPGSGKSMIAKRISGIMPPLKLEEFLEILSVQSAAGITLDPSKTRNQRPFRSPHHTISDVGLLGGGTFPRPGEISLAHQGVLFLDEHPEFRRSTLEVLRQPLEEGQVTISRSAAKVTLPATFMLVCAMNPCPCGYAGDPTHPCRCSITQIQRYRSRISGPLLDRIDIHVEAPALRIEELINSKPGESSKIIRARCAKARECQYLRFSHYPTNRCNSRMQSADIRRYCALDASLSNQLQKAMQEFSLSARAYDRILKVARTIADLAQSDKIESPHLLEAIQYRSLDRQLF
ncbi:MAG: Competence protein ComM [Opitutia bacterium UBA7350]|nr:MAG: Competence protein ComM [Opitutae bacterium UBA7350]